MNYSAVNTYRTQVFENVYQERKDALFAMTDSLLSISEAIINPAYLSLESQYSYGSFYQGLNKGTLDQTTLLQATLAATAKSGYPKLFAIDSTNIVKPRARASEERVLLHQSGHTRYSHNSAAGWKVQYLVQVTGEQTSWVVPLHIYMLSPFENASEAALSQIKLLCDNIKLAKDEKIIVLLDAGFHAPTLTYLVREHNLPVTLLIRLANNLVFYTNPSHDKNKSESNKTLSSIKDTLQRRGRQSIHGERLQVKAPDLEPTASICAPLERFGNTMVSAWSKVHSKLTGQKRQMVGGNPVSGTVISVQAQHFTRSGARGSLHLWLSDDTDLTALPLFAMLFTYLQRYSIEHMFRFLKHSFGMTTYHARDKHSYLNWLCVQQVAYTQLVLVKTITHAKPLPWNKVKRQITTPFKIWKTIKSFLLSLWRPVQKEKHYVPGIGKPRGTKQKKRKRYIIVRRTKVLPKTR